MNYADVQRDQELAATEEDAVTIAAREAQKTVHTALPGIIRSFDPATQTASVQLAIRIVWVDLGPQDISPCVDVPVFFPAGGGFVLTFPVNPGDECLVVFSERAIDDWFARGGVQNPSEFRMHDYSDGFALVGFASKPNAISNLSTDGAELRTRDGTTVFRLEDGTAYVGGKVGAEKALLAETYRQQQSAKHQMLLSAMQAVNAAAEAVGPGDLATLPPTVGALLLSFKAFFPIWMGALQTFEKLSPTYLADKAKVR